MENIELIILGSNLHFLDINSIKKHKSNIFKICDLKIVNNLPNPVHESGYLDQEYLDNQLREIVGPDNDNIRICIINCSLENNFYVRRIFDKTAVLSLWIPKRILDDYNISIENFIIKNIYEMVTMFIESKGKLTSIDAYSIPHIDTRGCLFDMNGDITNVIHNTEKPSICSSCKARLNTKSLPTNFIINLEKELNKINKKFFLNVELKIKKYPMLSLMLTIFLGIIINILSNILIENCNEIFLFIKHLFRK